MSRWPATKAKRVLDALLRIGWRVKRHRRGSHRVLERPKWPDFVFAFMTVTKSGRACLRESPNAPASNRTICDHESTLYAALPHRSGSDAMMRYKGYVGRVEFDDGAGLFHGEVINTRDVITFQGRSVKELRKAFRDSVENYLAFCAQRGEEPDKPFSGQFVTRITPELHRKVNTAAALCGKSLNAWVVEQLQGAVTRSGVSPQGKAKAVGRKKDRRTA